ncbi:MAG: hypothetical protein RR649_06565 [Carnobacterium sp.]
MDFFMRLPRSKKEFALFLGIVSILSVTIIAPLITAFEIGFTMETWKQTVTILPIIWIAVIILVLLVHASADKLSASIVDKNDSFRSQITINILCNVLLMSIFMTVIGSWIGQRDISLEPIQLFFHKWPRNFAISFAVEALIAQPIARQVLFYAPYKKGC